MLGKVCLKISRKEKKFRTRPRQHQTWSHLIYAQTLTGVYQAVGYFLLAIFHVSISIGIQESDLLSQVEFATVDLVWCCTLPKIKLARITYFWIQSSPAISEKKIHKPSLYSNIVWLSLYTQCKFQMDVSFPFIKLSSIKFHPRLFETLTGGVAVMTPCFGFSSKLFMF